ncbi:hypothetical protein [Oxalicibacterium faecigallinarum]|uniref:hypothetical protein n=1 Tax=Oxalicibacterium faecigallinarum TaxID=573741 RepID=UPI001662DBEA|nr:hypothetical protein [Oxalicibacterium faecigallinarum]
MKEGGCPSHREHGRANLAILPTIIAGSFAEKKSGCPLFYRARGYLSVPMNILLAGLGKKRKNPRNHKD